MSRRGAAAWGLALVLVTGCGRAGSSIDEGVQLRLAEQTQLARAALADGDTARAGELLDGIGDTVARARAEGRVTDVRAAAIMAALGDLEDELLRTGR